MTAIAVVLLAATFLLAALLLAARSRERALAGEVDALARAAREADRRIAAAEGERSLFRSIVSGMKEGLVVIGPDRRILLANEAFRQIFLLGSDPAGLRLAEVVRNPDVLAEAEAALRGGEDRETVARFSGSGRTFQLHATPVTGLRSGDGASALLLFFDVTRLEALESVRRDFVANVSHELRTPLTSIRAFVETLLEEGLEDRAQSLEFLEVVRKNAERMGALIDDLTDLSLIETGSVTLEMRDVDAAEIARDVVAQIAPRHAGSGVEVVLALDAPFVLRADRRRLEQVFVNLVDNGIKFNRRGGRLTISGTAEPGRRTLVFEDTGVGIPADSIEKVFHRFHRVDPERSRAAGGTGLGLAIVKHLMRLHGGEVRLESELGRGSRFTLEFPEPPH